MLCAARYNWSQAVIGSYASIRNLKTLEIANAIKRKSLTRDLQALVHIVNACVTMMAAVRHPPFGIMRTATDNEAEAES